MAELRFTEVNILQVRACKALQLGAFEHMSFSATKSFAINCQNVLESTRFRHEHTASETHEIFAFDKEVNAIYFYSSAEILESVASSRGEFVYDNNRKMMSKTLLFFAVTFSQSLSSFLFELPTINEDRALRLIMFRTYLRLQHSIRKMS